MLQAVLSISLALSVAPNPTDSSVDILTGNVAAGNARSYPQTKAFTRNGVPLWTGDLEKAHVWDWPAHYSRVGHSMALSIPKTLSLPKDSWVRFHCADNGPCDVAVFIYQCFPCESTTGGLPAYLLGRDEEFTRTRCAPTFTVREGGAKQRMTAFVTTIPRNTHISLQLPGEVKYVIFGISNGNGTPCPDLVEKSCVNTLNHCLWKKDHCVYNTCVQKGPGGCPRDTCADDEVERARR